MTDFGNRPIFQRARDHSPDELLVLLLAAGPLMFWLILGSLSATISAVIYFGLLAIAARLIARGQQIEARYNRARMAKPPRFPRKLAGSAMIGVIAFLLAGHQFSTWTIPAILGPVGFLLAIAAFGFDPWRNKGYDNPRYLAQRAAWQAVEVTDARLNKIITRVAALQQDELTLRTEAIRTAILRLIRVHAQTPREFLALRKALATFVKLAEKEVDALEEGWKVNPTLAGRRYTARITALADGFETRARKRSAAQNDDAFALEADLLLDRMEQNRAA
ncbi:MULTISPECIES: hypothetical protein [unclassified Roseivivax]|uniref:hypothetical protein n=1 Tax=Roseivivax sp. GX 12232 TaxID=2900547 RepID=UPI001E4832F4|nr:hypothetical protein [Roseivivax sp. GX 12232]MCE0507078.1 hypothetical protein [Roseivivax sp. GX 12232]